MNVAIIGGSGGIGRAFIDNLLEQSDVSRIHATYYNSEPGYSHRDVSWERVDITEESSVQAWCETLGEIDWVINAAGILHDAGNAPEKSIRRLDPGFFLRSMSVNALSTLLIAKHAQDKFKHGRPAVFAAVSAKVGSIQDNRLGGWYSYRASKAALNMCIRTLAVEWKRTLPNVTVAALHPGTTDTGLSKPFQKNVPEGKLFSPEYSTACMIDVLRSLDPERSGQFWAYDGASLPW
ncbi:MAG: SDR family NAD(P)-dependent oxidoreductase [Gammaproteobacteria bacterium]|nr:SDR family NAD(P)-dependent oxidoreductase [Gammaproteobacteria bacterium]